MTHVRIADRYLKSHWSYVLYLSLGSLARSSAHVETRDSQLCFATEAPFWVHVGDLFCSPGPGVTPVRIAYRYLKSH